MKITNNNQLQHHFVKKKINKKSSMPTCIAGKKKKAISPCKNTLKDTGTWPQLVKHYVFIIV